MDLLARLPTHINLINYKLDETVYTMVMEDSCFVHLFIDGVYQETFARLGNMAKKDFWDSIDDAISHYTCGDSEGAVKNMLMAAAEVMEPVYVSNL